MASAPPDRPTAARELARRSLVVLAVAAAAQYFVWRIVDTSPADGAYWFYVLFLVAEIVGVTEVLLFFLTTWRRRERTPRPAPAGKTVDVFIPTYNEPTALLRDTAVAARAMRYPHRTWLLDDGDRLEVAALAAELGCEYLARADRRHAKAGNLNHALAHSTADFVVTLDADHVPMPDLIEQLLGFFDDPKVALVQTNQDFFNLDSFQHATDWETATAWQQQELFFNVIQPGKDALGAAMYCGSPAMIRRRALDDVGGFATETITEDMHTGLRMQQRGWEVVYYNRSVARGLAPQTYLAYNTQWHRWGQGAMQVLRVENPLVRGTLTFGQRLAYFASFFFYWTSYQKLVFLLIPAFSVLTGIFPFVAEPRAYLLRFVPYLAGTLAATLYAQGGLRAFVNTERYNLIKLGAMLRSVSGLFTRRATFRVTPKARGAGAGWIRLLPYMALLALLATASITGFTRAVMLGGGFASWAFAVNGIFAAYFLYLLAPAVFLAMRRRELRVAYRFPRQLDTPVRYRLPGGTDVSWAVSFGRNMNRFGLSITLDTPMPVGSSLELMIELPGREIRTTASVRWVRSFPVGDHTRHAHGLRFEHISVADQDAIVLYLLWDVAPRHGRMLTMTDRSQETTERVA
ncbi:MAG TPA: glycosyltransferase family 2 protein [Gemmatimonadaceae bacterium]|nr:glycosyltransferase family 2 protein [Gemmatimonadaceae bacterium]